MQLQRFFELNPRIAVAYSGGVDSSYLLYAAKAAGCDVQAYLLKSQFQPRFELDDAVDITGDIGVALIVDEFDILNEPEVVKNPPDRCYYCKTKIFGRLWELARKDGYIFLCDGTNADDDESDRPGMRALRELGVLSPLRDSGLSKSEIRRLSEQAGLRTHNKPSYACLATRIPAGTKITSQHLEKIEGTEKALANMGFSDFRVRFLPPNGAKIQVTDNQWDIAATQRKEILTVLKPFFDSIVLDLVCR